MPQSASDFVQSSQPFLLYLKELEAGWKPLPLVDLVREAGGPERVACITVDVIKGFCCLGPLASPRVQDIVTPISRILTRCHQLGVRSFYFTQDRHEPDSREFECYPPHCLEGSPESEMVEELAALPFAGEFTVLGKRSISSHHGTDLHDLLLARDLSQLIVLGDCTDICVFQAALHLRTWAIAERHPWHVVVPASAVQTFDLSVEAARRAGVMAHDGDLLHLVALYQLQLNGIRVVSDLI